MQNLQALRTRLTQQTPATQVNVRFGAVQGGSGVEEPETWARAAREGSRAANLTEWDYLHYLH